MSSILIMAFDASGAIRFVGDVLRGAACGCFCPMCKSPLVAKQGKENEWHFSHEASQERPECEAGAENLARSLGIEFARELAERGSLVLPEYRTSAGVISAWLDRSQAVEWNAQISGPLAWREHPPKSKVVATGALDTGAAFALFVQVGDAGAPQVDDLPEHCAYGSPYQQKGLLQDAMQTAAGRLTQIQSLMTQINATTDQKSVLEIQARIGAENALLAHEVSQVQMLQGMADSEERIARSRERERQYEMLGRTGKVADFLP